jgi:hypothetical protein
MVERIAVRWLAGAMLALAAGCASVPGPQVAAPTGEPIDAWTRVLERFVDERGRVDFDGLARDRADLDRYVAWVYAVGPNNRPEQFPTPQHVLAYHLNAYNALAMYNVIEDGIPTALTGFKKIDFFLLRRIRVGGESTSLYTYENSVIRKLGDERIHFALNCMSIGCPRLPREPFRAATLDAVLDREARFFFGESRNLMVDDPARAVRVSEILRFFTGDFLAKSPSLVAYVNRYRATPIPADYAVSFIPYDWTVNTQRSPDRSR